jgi:hypothetical protein
MKNAAKELADEYMRLGGRRIAVIDDNVASSRQWESDSAEAAAFWKERVETLPGEQRRDVESFLPSLNDESDEPGAN